MTSTHPEPKKVIVVGGGITGLTAAYNLARLGCSVRLLEKNSRLGGSIGSESVDGWTIEAGPNTLLEEERPLRALCRDLGIEDDIREAEAFAKNRYVVRGGKPRPLPTSPISLFTNGLYSPGLIVRLFTEAFRRPLTRPEDVSLGQMIREHFGKEIVDYGLNPFVGGIYAGDPEQLSAQYSFPQLWESERSHGSLLRGQIAAAKRRKAEGRRRPKIYSFRSGLQELTDALGRSLKPGTVSLGASVVQLKRGSNWTVHWEQEGERHSETADAIVAALPAGALASISIETQDGIRQPFATLAELPHPPVSSLFLGFKRKQVEHALDGFGMLVPAIEKLKILGVLFSSSLFPGRAPDGYTALTIMAGGMRTPEIARLSAKEMEAAVLPDVRTLLGVKGDPVFRRFHTWKAAIPQYNLGYGRFKDAFDNAERDYPGLFVGGNARDGISVTNCIKAGNKLAARAAS